MTARRVMAVYCDHTDHTGRRWTVVDFAHTCVDARMALVGLGWTRDGDRDLCPDHDEPDDDADEGRVDANA